ncbi:MAG: dTMP kinase [Dehalococcoidia bacterium]
MRGSPFDYAQGRRGRGLFVALEGGEGAGKSTQAQALKERLEAAGRSVTLSREPGGTDLGREVWRIIARGEAEPMAELLLFAAARAQHTEEVVRPALERGEVVVADRYADSSVAYQGYGRGIALNHVRAVNHIATRGLVPNLTVLLDVAVEVGLARKGCPEEGDRIGSQGRDFHQRVRQGYLALAEEERERFLVVDGTLPPAEVTQRIWERVQALLVTTAD